MQIRIKRLIAAGLLGLALAFGAVVSSGLVQHTAQQAAPVQVADPGGHGGGTGGS